MNNSSLEISYIKHNLSLKFSGELTLHNLTEYKNKIDSIDISKSNAVLIDLNDLLFMDTAASTYIYKLQKDFAKNNIHTSMLCNNNEVTNMLDLVKSYKQTSTEIAPKLRRKFLEKIGNHSYINYLNFISFMSFLGELFAHKFRYLIAPKNIRFKEIAFEINESGVKALGIVTLTSFLIGLVIAYQSAHQLKLYGANIFIVEMLGISVLRELAPIITAIVIAGRSGSAFTAQIGAMKITEELDAMRTMGFDPYRFLVLPRIIALMVVLPILIFVSDVMAIIGGMVVANIDLGITASLFLDRFSDVVAAKHFFLGIFKGPFFAFLIATISIYRGLMVKNDTQSIGFNTTKSVVESIFAVIICDAVFSIVFTNLGI